MKLCINALTFESFKCDRFLSEVIKQFSYSAVMYLGFHWLKLGNST